MSRIVDRGAITAAWVGVGMAVTLAISFLLVIPIEPIVWYLSLPSAALIGYYANQRSDRRHGPWPRILANGVFAGVVTGLTLALLLLAVKALFFSADNGYRDPGAGGSLSCRSGPECVYQRYVADGRGPELEAQGVRDADSFSRLYWGQQVATAQMLVVLGALGGLVGAGLYAMFGRRSSEPESPGSATAAA